MNDKNKIAVKVYDNIAEKYAKTFPNPSSFIDEFISLLPKGGKVLDVGCGPGQDTEYLSRKGLNAEGIDLSRNMIKLPKEDFQTLNLVSWI